MFRVYELGSTSYDPFRGAGVPAFKVYSNSERYHSVPLARLRSNHLPTRFVIVNEVVESSILWRNTNSPILGSQEISISLVQLITGSGLGELKFTDPDTTKDYTFNGIYNQAVTISTNIQPVLDEWITFDSNTRNILGFSTVDKIVFGGQAYTRATVNQAVGVDANQNPIFLPLPEGYFYLHATSAILRLQTYETTKLVGDQPLKVYGKGTLGGNFDIIGANVTANTTVPRNNNVNQGSLDTTF